MKLADFLNTYGGKVIDGTANDFFFQMFGVEVGGKEIADKYLAEEVDKLSSTVLVALKTALDGSGCGGYEKETPLVIEIGQTLRKYNYNSNRAQLSQLIASQGSMWKSVPLTYNSDGENKKEKQDTRKVNFDGIKEDVVTKVSNFLFEENVGLAIDAVNDIGQHFSNVGEFDAFVEKLISDLNGINDPELLRDLKLKFKEQASKKVTEYEGGYERSNDPEGHLRGAKEEFAKRKYDNACEALFFCIEDVAPIGIRREVEVLIDDMAKISEVKQNLLDLSDALGDMLKQDNLEFSDEYIKFIKSSASNTSVAIINFVEKKKCQHI